MFDYSKENWELLFKFNYGIPYVYGITIGDNIEDASIKEYEITDHNADDILIQEFVDDYGISIEFLGDFYDLVDEMYIRFSVNRQCPDFERMIKGIYEYLNQNFLYTDKSAKYEYDSEDWIENCDIHLENELFNIDMYTPTNTCWGKTGLEICITPTKKNDGETRSYKSLNFWANRQDEDFCDFIDKIINIRKKEEANSNN